MHFFLQKCYHFLFQRYRLEHYTVSSNWLALSTVVVFTVVSLSRSVALFRGTWAGHTNSAVQSTSVTHQSQLFKAGVIRCLFSLSLQATTPPWICTQSSTASPRIQLSTQSLKADQSMCVWAKSGTASPAASYCHTSQYTYQNDFQTSPSQDCTCHARYK